MRIKAILSIQCTCKLQQGVACLTREHVCHFLSAVKFETAVKFDTTRLPTLLIVFDMRGCSRLLLEGSLVPAPGFWYSFWSSSRQVDTWKKNTTEPRYLWSSMLGRFSWLSNETQIKQMEFARFSFTSECNKARQLTCWSSNLNLLLQCSIGTQVKYEIQR